MAQARIRHIAINVKDREKMADYYKTVFGMEEKYRGPGGTIYLSDGYLNLALLNSPNHPWGINHFGFHVDSIQAIEDITKTKAQANTIGAVAESWIHDVEGNRVDITERVWPV
jgi:catechol 2,3-dioxygenase-like lactoylglutathione lyase family enzyme